MIDRSTPKPYQQGHMMRHSNLIPSGGDKVSKGDYFMSISAC
jgi:hypothetical protein